MCGRLVDSSIPKHATMGRRHFVLAQKTDVCLADDRYACWRDRDKTKKAVTKKRVYLLNLLVEQRNGTGTVWLPPTSALRVRLRGGPPVPASPAGGASRRVRWAAQRDRGCSTRPSGRRPPGGTPSARGHCACAPAPAARLWAVIRAWQEQGQGSAQA